MVWPCNELTELLDVDYPIIQAPMAGGPTTSDLVAAVSNGGGLGMIGAAYLGPDEIRAHIGETKRLTEKPFGINLFVPVEYEAGQDQIQQAFNLLRPVREELGVDDILPPTDIDLLSQFQEQVQAVIEEGVAVCSFTFGTPSQQTVNRLRERGIVVIGTATTVAEAVINQERGVDAVVAQGSEAGGHRGTFADSVDSSLVGLMALVPQMVDAVKVPVIAPGGIMDGRGILASLILGATGVQMGTAFLTTSESGTHPQHKQAVLRGTEDETVLTTAFSGKAARGLRNRFTEFMTESERSGAIPEYPIQNSLTRPIRQAAAQQNDPQRMALWCGQAPRLSKQQTAGELMAGLVGQVGELLGQLGRHEP